MENMAVIKMVDEPTNWVKAIACSRKRSGEPRICFDSNPVNRFIKRTCYKTPTPEEIYHKLAGANHFTKLDAKHGY